MRLQHEHTEHRRIGGLQDIAQQQEVTERFAHLLGIDLEHATMHPVVRERGVERRFRLRALVLVVRETQVRAAAMDVEGQMKILLGHGRAFDVPTRTAFAPRRRPARLAWLRRLPKREIERIALAVFKALPIGAQFAMTRFHLVHIAI